MDLYKSKHAGLAVKVRSELVKRHPVTGDIIETTPAVWAEFGEPTGEVRFNNPLTGEMDSLETYRGGVFSLAAAADERGWDEDVQAMVRRRLDRLCADRPAMIQRVDHIVAPAEKPWPTFDAETDVERIVGFATHLGLVAKTAAYERENLNRPELLAALDGAPLTADPAPEPEPVVAVTARREPDKLEPIILA